MAAGGAVDVGAALEPRRRLGLEPEPPARPANGRRLEERALQHHRLRRGADFGRRPAHHAANGLRPVGIGNDQHPGFERTVDAVERRMRSPARAARMRSARPASRSRSNACVGCPDLDHHVVRDVDDGVDAAEAGSLQPLTQPVRRRRRGATANICAQ